MTVLCGLLVALTASARADGPASPLALSGGLGQGLGGAPGASGVVLGVGRLDLDLGRFGFATGAREGLATADLRTVGGVFVGLRADLAPDWHLRFGFAHHHETPWEAVVDAPALALLGVSEGITHRSGAELAVCFRPLLGQLDWLAGGLDLSVVVLPDAGGPRGYVFFEQHLTLFPKIGLVPAE